MSHDFPDGPDWNPEPIDDDPWDVPEAHPEPPEPRCWGPDHWYPIIDPALAPLNFSPCECGETVFDLAQAMKCCPPEATGANESDEDTVPDHQ